MTATIATDLLGKLVSVYEVRSETIRIGGGYQRKDQSHHMVTGWIRSADVSGGDISLVLEVTAAPAWVDGTGTGDLLPITNKGWPGGGMLRFSLTQHPAGCGP